VREGEQIHIDQVQVGIVLKGSLTLHVGKSVQSVCVCVGTQNHNIRMTGDGLMATTEPETAGSAHCLDAAHPLFSSLVNIILF
jgi:hypothetical protein